MRVLVTGGYGCIGAWIVKNLIARGDSVWVYDLKEDPRRMRLIMTDEQVGKVQFLEGDVTDLDRLRQAMESNGIEGVIHLAGLQVPVCRADPLLGARVNVIGTLSALEAVRALGGQVKRIVYASSGAVHSPPEEQTEVPIPDAARLAPVTHYGVFKGANEGNARVYWLDHGISSIGLRPWTVYGVGRDFGMTSHPTKAMKAVVVGRKFHIGYGGAQDMQYVDDIAGTFIRCLEAPFEGARAYNVRGAVVDIESLHRMLVEVVPEAAELVTYGDNQLPIGFDLDDRALVEEIGEIPKTPLAEGIRATVEKFRSLQSEGRLDTSDLDE